MAEITKQALKVDNNQSFPNNNNGAITPSILRAFNTNMIDSLVDEIGYTADSSSWNQQIDALEQFTASASGLTTGSLLVTASAVSNVITFTKGNGSTFNVTVADTTDLSSLNAFTASATISLNNLNLWTSSYQPVIVNLQASQSIDNTKFNNIGGQSGSWDNTSLNSYTASNDTKWNTLGALSGSFVTESETGSFARTDASNTFTQTNIFTSISASSFVSASAFVGDGSKITNITASISLPILDEGIPQGNAFSMNFTGSAISAIVVGGTAVVSVNAISTASLNTLTQSFNDYTASTDAKFVAVGASTSSLNSFTASQDTKNSTLASVTASLQQQLTNIGGQSGSWITESETGSFARYDVSNPWSANQTFTHITAVSASFTYVQTLYETSSVIYSSGSNQFGDELSDIQTLSGSVKVQGSLTVNGTPVQTSSVDISALNAFTQSQDTKNSTLATYTQSVDSSLTNINSFTASNGNTSLNSYTQSNDTKWSNLAGQTGSYVTSAITASSLVTASFAGNTLTFTKGDASTFGIVIPDNSGSAGNFVTTSSFNAYTQSNDQRVSSLEAATASYVTSAMTASMSVASASFAATASFALNGGVTQILAGPNIIVSPLSGQGQVTISSTGTGSGGFNTATGSYGSFYDTTTQINPVANTARSMSFNETAITNGVSISGSTNPFNTYIKTENAGIYNLQFSAQLDKTDSGTDSIDIWIRKNGIDLLDTGTTVTLTGNNDKSVAAWNWFVQSAANDYYQIIWSSADTDMRLLAEVSSSIHPGIPSVIATVNRVDQFLSNTGSFSGSFTGTFNGYNLTEFTTTSSFNSYTSSTDSRLTNIETTTASLLIETSNLETFSSSALISISNLNTATASLFTSASLSLTTASFAGNTLTFTKGNGTTFGVVIPDVSGSTINTGSFATTGSNSFNGNQTITGSLILSSSAAVELQVIGNSVFTGSAFGNVVSMSITSNTASMDLNLGNYFTLTLAGTATTHISASNVQPGVSATLVITTGTNSSASLAPTMLQPSGSAYSATNGSAKKDVLSIVAVASGVPFVVSTKNMI